MITANTKQRECDVEARQRVGADHSASIRRWFAAVAARTALAVRTHIAGIHNPCRGPPPAIYPPAPRYYPSLFPGPFYGHPFYYAVPPPPFPFVVPLP
jgi:hypothetical protein